MTPKLFVLCLMLALPALTLRAQQGRAPKATGDVGFEQYKAGFIERLWQQEPDWATGVGYHNYDSVLMIPGAAGREQLLRFISREAQALGRFQPSALSP